MSKKIVISLPRERNPMVQELYKPLYRKRIEAKLKGRGSYNRNRRTARRSGDYLFYSLEGFISTAKSLLQIAA